MDTNTLQRNFDMNQDVLELLGLHPLLVEDFPHVIVNNFILNKNNCKTTKHGYEIRHKYGAVYLFPVTYKIECEDELKFKVSFAEYHLRSIQKSNISRVLPRRDDLDLFFTAQDDMYVPVIPNAAITLSPNGRLVLQEQGYAF